MVDTETSGSETDSMVHSAQYTSRAEMSSKGSQEIVFHNAESCYPVKFGLTLAKKQRRFVRVLRVQGRCVVHHSSRVYLFAYYYY
jgi:hypothetical protein